MIERLVWLDDSGFHVRDAKGKFHLHLSPERAKPLTTKAERAIGYLIAKAGDTDQHD